MIPAAARECVRCMNGLIFAGRVGLRFYPLLDVSTYYIGLTVLTVQMLDNTKEINNE